MNSFQSQTSWLNENYSKSKAARGKNIYGLDCKNIYIFSSYKKDYKIYRGTTLSGIMLTVTVFQKPSLKMFA